MRLSGPPPTTTAVSWTTSSGELADFRQEWREQECRYRRRIARPRAAHRRTRAPHRGDSRVARPRWLNGHRNRRAPSSDLFRLTRSSVERSRVRRCYRRLREGGDGQLKATSATVTRSPQRAINGVQRLRSQPRGDCEARETNRGARGRGNWAAGRGDPGAVEGLHGAERCALGGDSRSMPDCRRKSSTRTCPGRGKPMKGAARSTRRSCGSAGSNRKRHSSATSRPTDRISASALLVRTTPSRSR